MKKTLAMVSLCLISSAAFAANDWQLLCVPGSHTGCHSLWTTQSMNNGKSTVLFSYNVDGALDHPIPSIVIDLDNIELAPNTTHLTLTAGTKQIDIPVVAADNEGVMASLDQKHLYTISNVLNALQANKTVTLSINIKNNKTPSTVTIDTAGFNSHLSSMLHGDVLFAEKS